MKNLFVFGSTGYLGRGVTQYLLNKEFDEVFLFDRSESSFEGSNITKIQIEDITKEEAVSKAFKYIAITKDSENFLFSSLGGFKGGLLLHKTDYSDWKNMFKINIDGAFLIAKHFISKVEGLGRGSLLFTSAFSSFRPEELKIAYNTSKSALNYFIESLSYEVKNLGLTVNGIAPFILDTPENKEWVKDQSLFVSPEEIGKLVYSVFENYRILSGNILKLPGTL